MDGVRQPQYQQPVQAPMYQQPAFQPPANEQYMQPPYAPQPPRGPASFENMVDESFMTNIGAIMDNIDKEADKKAQEMIKQRMYEQKQFDILAAQQAQNMNNIDVNATLAAHADDFEVASEEDLRTNV